MCSVSKEFCDLVIAQCLNTLADNGIYLSCGTLVFTDEKPEDSVTLTIVLGVESYV